MFATSSNCYHLNTFLLTPDGEIRIDKIKRGMLVKTLDRFKKVVRLLEQKIKMNKEFVVFKKDSLGYNIPSSDLMITKGHPVYYRNKYINSYDFVKFGFFDNICLEKHYSEGLYHIQFEKHECILTNNIIISREISDFSKEISIL